MAGFRYEHPRPATPHDVRVALDQQDDLAAAHRLIGAALNHPDWREIQELCLRLLAGPNREIAATAATALGHLARIHGKLDLDAVRPRLEQCRQDAVVGPHADDALDDIEVYAVECVRRRPADR